jgi:hypothetical protein
MRSSATLHFIKYNYDDQIKENKLGGACSTQERNMHVKLWFKVLTEGDHSEDVGVDKTAILKPMLGQQGWKVWGGPTRLRTGTGGGFLRTR